MIIDPNEIMARNNGSTATLNLNINGGAVSIGSGTLSVGGDIEIPSRITHSGDTDTYIQFNAANQFRIVLGNSERMLNTSTVTTLRNELFIQKAGENDSFIKMHNATDDGAIMGTNASGDFYIAPIFSNTINFAAELRYDQSTERWIIEDDLQFDGNLRSGTNVGITVTRSWVDGGGTGQTHSVTVTNGIITGWTVS